MGSFKKKVYVNYNISQLFKSCIRRLGNCRLGFNPTSLCRAFSLVEMLMALLVASLLLAALAPVITKKVDEGINVNGFFNPINKTKKVEITYDSDMCPEDSIQTTEDGSQYCEGTYTVPPDYTGVIRVTVIGAGGGGGAAPTAGFTEYTTEGSTNNFTVPAMVDKLEATLISGGAGGEAGSSSYTYKIFKHPGTPKIMYDGSNYAPDANIIETNANGTIEWAPEGGMSALKGKIINIIACGGGGGGGGAPKSQCKTDSGMCGGSGGGAAGYYQASTIYTIPENATLTSFKIRIGGGGGGGGTISATNNMAETYGYNGGPRAGGGGGGVLANGAAGLGGGGGSTGGKAGNSSGDSAYNCGWGRRGEKGDKNESNIEDGQDMWICGYKSEKCNTVTGGEANGGNVGDIKSKITSEIIHAYYGGGGGAGSLKEGYGGGGGGASFYGGGGGGGGAATIIEHTGYHWSGGGGGGGGCDYYDNKATLIHTGGGGGGGGSWQYDSTTSKTYYAGGNAAICTKKEVLDATGGKGGRNASGSNAGIFTATIFGPDFCNGGNGVAQGGKGESKRGESGKPGAMKIEYITYKNGGSGGGRGNYIERKEIKVNEKEEYNITIGKGTIGGIQPHINPDGTLQPQINVAFGEPTILQKNDEGKTIVLNTGKSTANRETGGPANGLQGGNGAILTTAFTTCEAAKGGKTADSPNGANAKGYGCGGGGAYSLGLTGKGSGGYARLSWNKYWDAAKEAYRLADTGTGGGGASGNVMTYSIAVMGGDSIRIRIGKGGEGASVINNTVSAAKKGGDTLFGNEGSTVIKAGGGGGGGNPGVVNGVFINGIGGSVSSLCHFGSKSYLKNTAYCTLGDNKELNALPNTDENGYAKGAKGGSLKNYGTGGEGGISGTSSYLGKPGTGFGAGGGGAGIRDLGNTSVSEPTSGENRGGNGANGKIIIEMFET